MEKEGNKASDIRLSANAFGHWMLAKFKRCKFSIENEIPVSISLDTDEVHDILLLEPQIGLKQVSEELNISYEPVII